MDSFPHLGLDRREYRIKWWLRTLYLFIGITLMVSSVMGCVAYSVVPTNPALTRWSPLFLLALGIYTIALASRSKLVIEATRVQVQSAFRERSADLSSIEGFRTVRTRYGSNMQLRLKDGLGAISIPGYFDTDDAFRKWTQNLKDLDQSGREELLDAIARQESLGATRDERLNALATARTWGVFLLILAVAGVAVLFLGDAITAVPSALALALIPVIIILLVLRSPLLYTVFKPKADPRAELSYALMVASFGLLLRSAGIHLVSMQPLLYLIVPVGIIYAASLYKATQNNAVNAGRLLLLLMLAGVYSYGLGVSADTLEDGSTPTSYAASVLGKHSTHGRSTSYYLQLAPWGPVDMPTQIGVSYELYNQTMPGDQVCLILHGGLLNIPWYRAVSCSFQSGSDSTPQQ